ncbi:MAG: FAD:protein FMN transferase [Bacteroidota bacterium]
MSVDLYHNNFFTMGTRMDLIFWGLERRFAHSVFQSIFNETNRLESVLSRFDEDSLISHINASAGIQPVEITDELFSLLSMSCQYQKLTNGLFDITALPLIQALSLNNQQNEEIVHKARELTGIDKMKLDRENQTAYLEKKGMQIDLGGIGKGVALEHIDRILDNQSISNAFISFGESSVLAKGQHPYGDCWKIGIRHIADNQQNVYSLNLKDVSLSTSGNTSEELRDIVNPKTGKSPDKVSTTSVVSKSPVDAEILSTALLLASDENKKQIIKNLEPEKATEIIYENNQPYVKEWYNKSENIPYEKTKQKRFTNKKIQQ